MSEDKKSVFRGEINESDIEKESLSPSQIDDVAGGTAVYAERRPSVSEDSIALCNASDMENRIPARNAPETEASFILDKAKTK